MFQHDIWVCDLQWTITFIFFLKLFKQTICYTSQQSMILRLWKLHITDLYKNLKILKTAMSIYIAHVFLKLFPYLCFWQVFRVDKCHVDCGSVIQYVWWQTTEVPENNDRFIKWYNFMNINKPNTKICISKCTSVLECNVS